MGLFICRINSVLQSKSVFIQQNVIPETKNPILDFVMSFVRYVIGLSSSSGSECLPEKHSDVIVNQAY